MNELIFLADKKWILIQIKFYEMGKAFGWNIANLFLMSVIFLATVWLKAKKKEISWNTNFQVKALT